MAAPSAGGPTPLGSEQGWRPIFDGSSLAGLKAHDAWQIENGALIRLPGNDSASQSQETFGDVDIRFRFQIGRPNTYFKVRQGEEGFYEAKFNPSHRASMEGKTHELIFVCRGDSVTATLNGSPTTVTKSGTPLRGRIQFNERTGGTGLRILAIDVRVPAR